MDEPCAVVLVTAPDEAKASQLARTLVEERLAACVNCLPLRSVYRWEGAVQEDAEVLLLIKTLASGFERLRSRVLSLHPYQCPEVVLLPIERGHPPYLEWLRGSVDRS
jgi:periplasmic divalent cation tolerance protein